MKKNSVLLQLNTRVWFNELKKSFKKVSEPFYLDLIPVSVWQSFKDQGFDVIYLLGVWKVDTLTKDMFDKKNLKEEFDRVLPDWTWEDTCGSPFSINEYVINPVLGNEKTLSALHEKLNSIGLELVLDFVPNHFGLQTPYVERENLFIEEKNFSGSTKDYDVLESSHGKKAIYHGKDPYFPPWEDTFQLDYSSQETRAFMIDQMLSIAKVADGIRCDMAMLLVSRIFQQNWGWKLSGKITEEFWKVAIEKAKAFNPEFTFIAEVYWDMEEELINLGFDYCYDKKLYDSLRDQNFDAVNYCLTRNAYFQDKTTRFLENHDEERAVNVFNDFIYLISMEITYLLPGLKFFHEGQLEGRRIKDSLFLQKRDNEETNEQLKSKYSNLLKIISIYLKNDYSWVANPDIIKHISNIRLPLHIWEWNSIEERKSLIIMLNYTKEDCEIKINEQHNRKIYLLNPDNVSDMKLLGNEPDNLTFTLKTFQILLFKFQQI